MSNCDLSQKSPHMTAAGRFEMVISTPISANVCWRNCCVCSRRWLPEVVELANDRRTPSFARIPSAPGTQPASSRIWRARSRLNSCAGRFGL